MAENNRGDTNPLHNTAQTVRSIESAIKTGKAVSSAAKGMAVGGVWGAVSAAALQKKKCCLPLVIGITVVVLLPVLILCMLPSIIFGALFGNSSSSDGNMDELNNYAVIEENINTITESIITVMTEALDEVSYRIKEDYESSNADGYEIVNPYSDDSHIDVYKFIGQYCASKDSEYATVSVKDLTEILQNNKDKIYSFTKAEEIRKEAEDEAEDEKEETWLIYTVIYNGEDYFADEVFYLTDKQKEIAKEYAYNLTLFLEDR